MSSVLAPPPLQSPIVETSRGFGVVLGAMTPIFENWLRSLVDRAQVAAFGVATVAQIAQTAAIATTDLVPLANGLYRVSYQFRVTTVAGVSSSIQFHVTSTEGGVTCTQSSAAYTGNVNNAPQSGSFLVNADPSSPIAYSVSYASNPAAQMAYALSVRVESL